ncbi:TLC domain-containing protein 5 [Acropora cervicornis]|uniref:TLC domain-containing protein 5 n=1 Tax=Acropora cervicornis TaxID=6130 RepID=A0AAD9R6N9_ACRCE|nr:TLC domain-containing protein 5 [Acropora cervicornis]
MFSEREMLSKAISMSFISPFLPSISTFFLWSTAYFFLCILNYHRSYEWNCRLVTIWHASLVTILCSWCAFITGPWPLEFMGDANTPFQSLIAAISLGYFVFDFLWCLYMGTEGIVMLFHHVISISGIAFVQFNGYSGPELIATILGTEISNPFLQLRWFMRETKNYETFLAKMNDIIFMAMFIGWRIGPGSLLWYQTVLVSSKPKLFVKIGGTGVYDKESKRPVCSQRPQKITRNLNNLDHDNKSKIPDGQRELGVVKLKHVIHFAW